MRLRLTATVAALVALVTGAALAQDGREGLIVAAPLCVLGLLLAVAEYEADEGGELASGRRGWRPGVRDGLLLGGMVVPVTLCAIVTSPSVPAQVRLRLRGAAAAFGVGATLCAAPRQGVAAWAALAIFAPLEALPLPAVSLLFFLVLRATLARSFSRGEAVALAQLLALCAYPCALLSGLGIACPTLVRLCQGLLWGVMLVVAAITPRPGSLEGANWSRVALRLLVPLLLAVFGVVYPLLWRHVLLAEPFSWLVAFISEPAPKRPLLVAWFAAALSIGVAATQGGSAAAAAATARQSKPSTAISPPTSSSSAPSASRWRRVPLTVQRKAFHLLAVLIFLPGALLDPTLLMLASVGAVCVVAVLEAVRVTRAPLLGAAVHRFMYQFVDERDGGAVILTHLYLLLGCAAPLWLHYSLLPSQPTRLELLPALSGVLVLGVGDSAASLFGVALGRSRWGGGSHKTIEGSLAMFFAVVGCAGAIAPDAVAHRGLWAASALATLVEAWTDQIDNLILPLVFYSALVATGVAVA